jgi:Ca-activated chloride channel homolog
VDLHVVSSPARIVSLEPVRMPDLFAGQELVVLGRYQGSGSGPLVIEGTRDGRTVRVSTPVSFAAHDTDHEYVGTLWAARRIGALTRTMRLEGQTPARIEEIKALALRHGIVTEYTAYLVQEPTVAVGGVAPGRDEARRMALPAAPASAKAQTGRVAFEAAQTSADFMNVVSVSGARQVSERAQDRGAPAGSGGVAQRIVGSRRFEQQGAQWKDLAQRAQRVVTVEAFSPAYFALLQALPELRDAAALGDDVLVAGQRASVRIHRSGQSTLASREVVQLTKDFRGA